MSKIRKERVLELREEGRKAAEEGKSRQTNPYMSGTMDRVQWFFGYDFERNKDNEN